MARLWEALADPTSSYYNRFSQGGIIDGKFYICRLGNQFPATLPNYVTIYNINLNSWSLGAACPSPATEDVYITICNGKLYYIGGAGAPSGEAIKETWVYDPPSNIWTRLADLPLEMAGGACASWNNDFIFVTGCYLRPPSFIENRETYKYQISTNTWTRVADQGSLRTNLGPRAATLGDKIYVTSGESQTLGNAVCNDLDTYDPITNTWTTIVNYWASGVIGAVRRAPGIASTGEKIWFVGGAIGGSNPDPGCPSSVLIPTFEVLDNGKTDARITFQGEGSAAIPPRNPTVVMDWFEDHLYALFITTGRTVPDPTKLFRLEEIVAVPSTIPPWLRQRQRDDVARVGGTAKNRPTSKQRSIRQGWANTYL